MHVYSLFGLDMQNHLLLLLAVIVHIRDDRLVDFHAIKAIPKHFWVIVFYPSIDMLQRRVRRFTDRNGMRKRERANTLATDDLHMNSPCK